jgi:uncharacterized integral membrane protein
MEFILTLAMKFWQWTVLIALIIIGFIINLFDKKKVNRVNFKYKNYPHMIPLRIATKDKGFWGAIIMWLFGVRHWEIARDFEYELNGVSYVIPKGFQFDGASVPKFLATFLSPVGVLLIGGLIHDYAYKYACLKPTNKKEPLLLLNQKKADQIFRDINIEINGFYFLNYLAYWALRLGGFVAWNGHRKVNAQIGE